MKRKIAMLMCSVLVFTSMLVGCSSDTTSTTETTATETTTEVAEEATEEAAAPVADTLTVLVSSTTYSDAQQAIYDGFTEATGIKTDIQVVPGDTSQYQQIVQSKLLTQDYPDILTYWGDPGILLQLQADQHMNPVTNQEYIDKVSDGIYDMSGTYEGVTYGLPISGVDFTALLYNQDIFDDLGLEAPTSYDELVEVCQAIVDSGTGIIPIYEMGKQGGPLQCFGFVETASYFVTEEGAEAVEQLNAGEIGYEETPILDAYEKKMALQDAGYMNDKTDMMTGTWDTMFEAIANEKAAMSFVYSNMIPNLYQSYPDVNVNMTAFNGVASGSCTQFLFSLKTGNTAAQDAFFEYLFQDGVLETYYNTDGLVPAYKDMECILTQPMQSMYDIYTNGEFTQNYGDRLLLTTTTRIASLQEMHVKTKTPLEACEYETAEYAKIMEERGQ